MNISSENEVSSTEDAARRDSAVHVSLSSYSPVKQPGTVVVPLPGEPGSRRSLRPPTEIGCLDTLINEELRRRAVAPCEADGAPYGPVYSRGPCRVSTPKQTISHFCDAADFGRPARKVATDATGADVAEHTPESARLPLRIPASPGGKVPHLGHIPRTYFALAGGVRSGDSAPVSRAQRRHGASRL
jgi:hypothetical protein